jgi:hypothetical protein
MRDYKIASTPERAPATRTTDDTHYDLTEQSMVLTHMLNGSSINADQAYLDYGIRHLHSVIPKIERYIQVSREEINRPHPSTGKIRVIARYWIDHKLIGKYSSAEARTEFRKQQTSTNISKSRANDNKALVRMCGYCKRETLEAKLYEIYGQQAANDSN